MRKILRSPVTTIILFAIAAGLIIPASIGGTRAALNIESEFYVAEIILDDIDVGLTESNAGTGGSDNIVPDGGVLLNENNVIPEGEDFTLGTTYDEVLKVINTGNKIPEYVRVSVFKYWEKDGEKALDLDPSLIDLHFVEGNGWNIDHNASTAERTMLYYSGGVLQPGGGLSSEFTDTLTVSTQANTSEYAGASCHIEVIVDAVQDHNAGDAITSAWGYNFLGIN